jgi:glycosyltransferase involved in cell wall biosynthesis
MDHPFVSVIIPVYNDAKRLTLCLSALEQQTYPQAQYEVIVIDNASDPEQNIAGVVAQFGQTIAAYEAVPGSYAARNTGIDIARGEVIAFTDADCIPAPNWIETGVSALLSTPNCGLVAGRIEIFFQNPDCLTSVELYESVMAFQQQEHLEKYQYGSTANVFTFKRVLNQVGRFDAAVKSNGDYEWGRRVAAAGFQQRYAADVCIAHPARRTFAELFKRTTRLAGGIYDAQIQKRASLIDRNKLFFRIALEIFFSPMMFALNVIKDDRLKTIDQKIRVSLITFAVKYLIVAEMLRLKLGGVSSRG